MSAQNIFIIIYQFLSLPFVYDIQGFPGQQGLQGLKGRKGAIGASGSDVSYSSISLYYCTTYLLFLSYSPYLWHNSVYLLLFLPPHLVSAPLPSPALPHSNSFPFLSFSSSPLLLGHTWCSRSKRSPRA